jgi:protein-L-isoaspartate(D-aspartate) O-methyltransferase
MIRLIIILFLVAVSHPMERRAEREEMVKHQIQQRGISNPYVLQAMMTVERHLFVPESLRPSAYGDFPLSIGYDQTISQPYIVAYMTAAIQPEHCRKVLEIGTGSGYQAAVLAEIIDSVFTVEIVRPLAEQAARLLKQLGYHRVMVKTGDGYKGWPEHAPYDGIIVTAAVESIPSPLVDQLKEGGRMVIPVGSPYSIQQLVLVEKQKGIIRKKSLLAVRFVPFQHREE